MDSRQVAGACLFIASSPPLGDGTPFIKQAVQQGAVAIIQEAEGSEASVFAECDANGKSITYVKMPKIANKIGEIGAIFNDLPSNSLPVIGITGTNGKTTVSFLVAQALEALGKPTGILGTVGYGFPKKLKKASLTTPMPTTLQALMAEQVAQGAKAIAMEVSSHSLDQHRVAGIHFDTAVFTNLSHDHLDYHGDMASYAYAKRRLLVWPGLEHRLINGDDHHGRTFIDEFKDTGNTWVYSTKPDYHSTLPMIKPTQVCYQETGLQAEIVTPWGAGVLASSLLGAFNLSNLLAVVGVLGIQGYALDQILAVIPQLASAPGRMQLVYEESLPRVIIDYSHTPAALEAALVATRQHYRARIFCIFGCGGNRDAGKRPMMGDIATRLSDHAIITNDNPRHELPEQIADDIIAGIKKGSDYHVELDRGRAIAYAIQQANMNDVILIAGKGHEDYQQVNDDFHHFSDYETVLEMLTKRKETTCD